MKQWSFSYYRLYIAVSQSTNTYLINMPFQPSRFGLNHFDITGLAATEDSSWSLLMTKQIVKSSQNCDSCSSPMVVTSCAATKSADLLFGGVDPARRQRTSNLDSGSVLQGSNQPFQRYLSRYSTSYQSRSPTSKSLYRYFREERLESGGYPW
jgi:hypothetical protein